MSILVEYVDAKTLQPNPYNPNAMSADLKQRLQNSMDRLGIFKPVIVRELNGQLEVLAGWHRTQIASERDMKIPIVNLGEIDDKKAKEISIADNARWGHDDPNLFADLLHTLELAELSTFLPGHYEDIQVDLAADINLDDLGIEDVKETREPTVATHTTLKFRVPLADAHIVTDKIDHVIKEQGFDGNSAEKAGDALLFLFDKLGSVFDGA